MKSPPLEDALLARVFKHPPSETVWRQEKNRAPMQQIGAPDKENLQLWIDPLHFRFELVWRSKVSFCGRNNDIPSINQRTPSNPIVGGAVSLLGARQLCHQHWQCAGPLNGCVRKLGCLPNFWIYPNYSAKQAPIKSDNAQDC